MNFRYIFVNILAFTFLFLINFYIRSFTFEFSTLDWDELTYFILGKSILSGYLPYQDFWDLKPIGIYAIHAVSLVFFEYSILTLRYSGLIFSTALAFILFLSLKGLSLPLRLFVAVALLYLFLIFHSGLSSNTEIYFLTFEALAFYLIFQTKDRRDIFTQLGFFVLGIGFLIKYIIVFDVFLFLTAWNIVLYIEDSRLLRKFSLKKFIIRNLQIGFFFSLPFIISCIYYYQNNALGNYFEAIFFVLKGHSKEAKFVERLLFLSQLKYIFLTILILIIFSFKLKSKPFPSIIIFVWIMTAAIGAVWTGFLYEHYLLAILYPAILLIGILILPLEDKIKNVKLKPVLFFIMFSILGYHLIKTRIHLEKTLNGISDKGKLVSKAISEKIATSNVNGQKYFFVSNGSHAPYILLNQLPPVKWVQPNNFSEKIFFDNLKLDLNELFVSLDKQKISVVSWCYQYTIEDLDSGKVVDKTINEAYVKKLNLYLQKGNFKMSKLDNECLLYYL